MSPSAGLRAAAVALLLAIGPLPASLGQAQQPDALEITVACEDRRGSFSGAAYAGFSCDGIYGQATSLQADSALEWVRATGAIRYARCYNWLGDGMPRTAPGWFSGCRVARRSAGGGLEYDWSGLERVLDTLLASGIRPVIVCGGLPDALLTAPIRRNEGGAAANSPDPERYRELLSAMFRRLVRTYTAEEVRNWYFEVWDQPDHAGSWEYGREAPFDGKPEQAAIARFCALWDALDAAAKSVDAGIRIGGPGLAGDPEFLRAFLAHCTQTGRRLPAFLSWQRYGPAGDVVRWNQELRDLIRREFPQLANLPVVVSECGSGAVEGARSATAYEAARMAALVHAEADSPAPSRLLLRAGDLVDDHFDGFRSLTTRIAHRTLPLPAFRLCEFLTHLGPTRLGVRNPRGAESSIGVLATMSGGERVGYQALVYHHDPSAIQDAEGFRRVIVQFTDLPRSSLTMPVRTYRIDSRVQGPFEAWVAAGRPRPAPRSLADQFESLSNGKPDTDEPLRFVNSRRIAVEVQVPANSVVLVTLGSDPPRQVELCRRAEYVLKAEAEYNAAAALHARGEHERAVGALRAVARKYADTSWREEALYSVVGILELDLQAAERAEEARKELLALPLDDLARAGHLRSMRIRAIRTGQTAEVSRLSAELGRIDARLSEQRHWPLRRWRGSLLPSTKPAAP